MSKTTCLQCRFFQQYENVNFICTLNPPKYMNTQPHGSFPDDPASTYHWYYPKVLPTNRSCRFFEQDKDFNDNQKGKENEQA